MKALEVFINGHRLCLAGVGDDGVLNAIVNWVGRPGQEDDIFLSVGALDCTADEHLRWSTPSIGVGAEVLVRVVAAAAVDPPDERHRSERPSTLEQYRECLREFSERLTDDERQHLLRELVADLEHGPASGGTAEASG
jgi:hypothetical protein